MKMIINNIKKFCLLLVALCLCHSAFAQTYWKEDVGGIAETGYHHIEISPEIAGLGLHTLRILDNDGNEIPYFIRSSIPVRQTSELDMYQIVSKKAKDSLNVIKIRDVAGNKISRFYLLMKQADVRKQVSIRGSNDNKEWFTVKQRSNFTTDPGTGMAVIDFPESDYWYYEITITNNSGSPLNITGVGKVKTGSAYGQFIGINAGRFTDAEDRETRSTVVSFPDMAYPYLLSKLEIGIQNREHYNREAWIIRNNNRVANFTLSSRQNNTFFFNKIPIDSTARIVIDNGDNLPLVVESAQMYSLDRYLCAYLESGKNYFIDTEGSRNKRYDIQDFANDIPAFLPVVKTSHLQAVTIAPEPEPEKRFFEKPFFLWGVIILTGLVLVWVCITMLRDMRKR